ncbi:MAG TPA: hypothetical protein VF170_06390 [Planctomycetaceae bacterium]
MEAEAVDRRGLLWLSLPVLYALSLGPALYGVARGWIPHNETLQDVYEPLTWMALRSVAVCRFFNDYGNWWWRLGERHEAEAASD